MDTKTNAENEKESEIKIDIDIKANLGEKEQADTTKNTNDKEGEKITGSLLALLAAGFGAAMLDGVSNSFKKDEEVKQSDDTQKTDKKSDKKTVEDIAELADVIGKIFRKDAVKKDEVDEDTDSCDCSSSSSSESIVSKKSMRDVLLSESDLMLKLANEIHKNLNELVNKTYQGNGSHLYNNFLKVLLSLQSYFNIFKIDLEDLEIHRFLTFIVNAITLFLNELSVVKYAIPKASVVFMMDIIDACYEEIGQPKNRFAIASRKYTEAVCEKVKKFT